MAKKGGLGRGLDILFQDTGAGGGDEGVSTLRLAEIEPDKNQPRKAFDDTALSELAASITEHGVLQPIVVRPSPAGGYIIVAGERRWRAARLAGLTEIPALIKDISDTQAMEIALIENLQREDLDPVEEALGYRQLMERCSYTQEAGRSTAFQKPQRGGKQSSPSEPAGKSAGISARGQAVCRACESCALAGKPRSAAAGGRHHRQRRAECTPGRSALQKNGEKTPSQAGTHPPSPALRGGIEPERGSGY